MKRPAFASRPGGLRCPIARQSSHLGGFSRMHGVARKLTALHTKRLGETAMHQVVAGDVAWVLVSTILVLLMTVPGLALFYAGMVRKKNVLAIMMQSFSLCAAMTIVWMVAGYSI